MWAAWLQAILVNSAVQFVLSGATVAFKIMFEIIVIALSSLNELMVTPGLQDKR